MFFLFTIRCGGQIAWPSGLFRLGAVFCIVHFVFRLDLSGVGSQELRMMGMQSCPCIRDIGGRVVLVFFSSLIMAVWFMMCEWRGATSG